MGHACCVCHVSSTTAPYWDCPSPVQGEGAGNCSQRCRLLCNDVPCVYMHGRHSRQQWRSKGGNSGSKALSTLCPPQQRPHPSFSTHLSPLTCKSVQYVTFSWITRCSAILLVPNLCSTRHWLLYTLPSFPIIWLSVECKEIKGPLNGAWAFPVTAHHRLSFKAWGPFTANGSSWQLGSGCLGQPEAWFSCCRMTWFQPNHADPWGNGGNWKVHNEVGWEINFLLPSVWIQMKQIHAHVTMPNVV